MEMLSMGPGRRSDDPFLQVADATDAEPVDLGVQSRPAEHGSPDADQRQAGAGISVDEPEMFPDHWLSGLVRADVLAVSGAALLLLIAVGLPFLTAFDTVRVYVMPNELNPAWTFAPTLVAAGVAAVLGLGGLRQAAYQGAAAWVRVTAGVAGTVGTLMVVGTAIVWFAMTQSDPFDPFRPPG